MKATKICKICGNEYEYCHTFRRDSIFRWQDVACCVEHGNQYFAEIAASRGGAPVAKSVVEEAPVVEAKPQIEEVVEETLSEDVVSEEIVEDAIPEYFSSSRKKSRR